MAGELWHQARLIPTSGVNGAREQERRVTSALLAVMSSVNEFGRSLIRPLGAPAGHLQTYIEVPFQFGDKRYFPDGLIRVERGQRTWTALVEVKTGNDQLELEQIEHYVEIARQEGYDAVLTLSNEVPALAGRHPTKVNKRKLGKIALHHLSWTQVLTVAVMHKKHRGIPDPDQAWILGELIRYLEHPRSGALEFNDMGPNWVAVRDAVANGTLRPGDRGVADITGRFDALLRYAGLRLGRELGAEVTPIVPRRELADPALRTQTLVDSLGTNGILQGAMRIPDTVGPLEFTVDLRTRTVACQVNVNAPRAGRPTTRVNWLVRQLRQAPGSLRIEAFAMHSRGPSVAALLHDIRQNSRLLVPANNRELRAFRITMTMPMGSKRGSERGSFIKSVLDVIDGFYAAVHQHIKAWTGLTPRLRDIEDQPTIRPVSPSSTGLSWQDGPEPEEIPTPGPAYVGPLPSQEQHPDPTPHRETTMPEPADNSRMPTNPSWTPVWSLG